MLTDTALSQESEGAAWQALCNLSCRLDVERYYHEVLSEKEMELLRGRIKQLQARMLGSCRHGRGGVGNLSQRSVPQRGLRWFQSTLRIGLDQRPILCAWGWRYRAGGHCRRRGRIGDNI